MEDKITRRCDKYRCIANMGGLCAVETCEGQIISSDFQHDDPQITPQQYTEIHDYIDESLRKRERYKLAKESFAEYFSPDYKDDDEEE